MIKITDYTQKLDRLNAMEGSEDDIDAEFERVCEELFGATLDDISDDEFERINQVFMTQDEWVKYCRSQGYDLTYNGYAPVPHWESFALMVMARAEGLLPATPAERMERRLAAEAGEFVRNKDKRV